MVRTLVIARSARRLALAAALALTTPPVHAGEPPAGEVRIEQPRARAMPPGAHTAAVYLTIDNRAGLPDRLLGARSPRAKAVELHSMFMDGGVMRMRGRSDVPVPARGRIELAPGGTHLMVIDPAPALRSGDRMPLTLIFERAGAVAVEVEVEDLQTRATPPSR